MVITRNFTFLAFYFSEIYFMLPVGFVSLTLIVLNGILSYKGFYNKEFFEKYCFEVEKVRLYKDYKVLVTSGFLHVSWTHLILNMLSLYFFSSALEFHIGAFKFLIIYFSSLIGGNLFSLYIHRNDNDFRSVGASGAVCGIVFATIAIFPDLGIGFFGIPFRIPGWVYGILFVLYSIYGIRSRYGNIGHETHLAGALTGMLISILFYPSALVENYPAILLIIVPSVIFIYVIIKNPAFLLVDNYFFKNHEYHTIDDKYNIDKKHRQDELDRLLEKIHKKGMKSLSRKERQTLNELTKK